jgi:hypothetical protein
VRWCEVGRGGGNAKALMNMADEMEVDLLDETSEDNSILQRLRVWWLRNKPLQAEYRRVSAKFGAGVTTYFLFYRFLFLQFFLMSIISISFTAAHVSKMLTQGKGFAGIMGVGSSSYGYMPQFMYISSYGIEEAFDYSIMVVLGIVVLILSTAEHLISEDRGMKEVDATEIGNELPWCREVLCSWDCSVVTQQEADDQYQNLANKFVLQLDETERRERIKGRSRLQKAVLYLRRFIALCLYLALQSASFTAIIYLTINEESIVANLKGTPFSPLASSLTPFVLGIINFSATTALKAITAFESWDSALIHTSLLLGRTYLFTIANNIIVVMGYVLQADPFLLADLPTIRNSVAKQADTSGRCLLDQGANQLFALVVTTFAVKEGISNFLYPIASANFYQYVLGKVPAPKYPFDIVDSSIDLLGFVSLVLATFPFAPLTLLFGPIMIFWRIQSEIWVLMNYQAKPEKPWKAHYSGVIFTSIYLLTISVFGLTASVYFLSSKTFAKQCSIQDNFVELCASSVDPNTQTCTKSTNSQYYDFYKNTPYPAAFCNNACGAFIDQRSAFAPFKESISAVFWDALFTYPYVPWFLFVMLMIQRELKRNTRHVSKKLHEQSMRAYDTKLELMTKEQKRKDKRIERLTLQLGDAAEVVE